MSEYSNDYRYDANRIVTLLRQTLTKKKIWSVDITTNRKVESKFENAKNYLWEVDCDLDTFVLHQNEIESEDSDRELSKRIESQWVLVQDKEQLFNWLDNAESELDLQYKNGKFPFQGLLPIIAQDENGRILMQAWGNRAAITETVDSNHGTYFSRSRNKLWIKGEESGHLQSIQSIELQSSFPFAIVYHVKQTGAACHTGEYSCFFRKVTSWNAIDLKPV
ncbi:phosphoribosyl-AMP cyclohydrolase [Leptospira sp. GIMC2001]|uniref:phosphoribosyl-AMP cyclohydrolase n=1 Tax=Leptospira sp. GIMC2001 TaxID=1513297 RepID=UPI0023494E79|nr:phosphoribosyl-AMP cyclohydrolase [Leptospira sp. GIMC2001]WCL49468.1 hypothetical protein O4O04_19595 [Leptospira sp. GIMC2001]